MNHIQKPGLLGRIVLAIATLALVVVGFFFFTIALVAGAILALVIGVRLWWTLRKFKRAQAEMGSMQREPGSGTGGAIDGEYQVVERETSAERLPPKRQ